ncbi:hypothetical protein [Ruminiclostridium josui]|uniref:hypothetical protein n=1 Tax=Ruminiclostridium josui TaxID=1499 RepID=UPI000463216B|nr:hypothetical protein [Ruminiclostridium josui]
MSQAKNGGYINLDFIDKVDSKSHKKTQVFENGELYTKTEFTNKQEMKDLMELYNEKAPDGYKIEKVELVRADNTIAPQNTTNTVGTNAVVWDYYIKSTTDYGSGWYNSTDDLLDDSTWNGPDTAVVQISEKVSATYSGEFGVSVSDISAKVGFSVTGEVTLTKSSTTPVPAGKKLNVKTYATFHKVSYDVWADNILADDTYYATGYAYDPNGVYFAKFWYTL